MSNLAFVTVTKICLHKECETRMDNKLSRKNVKIIVLLQWQ